jgi:hypothetical protein
MPIRFRPHDRDIDTPTCIVAGNIKALAGPSVSPDASPIVVSQQAAAIQEAFATFNLEIERLLLKHLPEHRHELQELFRRCPTWPAFWKAGLMAERFDWLEPGFWERFDGVVRRIKDGLKMCVTTDAPYEVELQCSVLSSSDFVSHPDGLVVSIPWRVVYGSGAMVYSIKSTNSRQ